MRRWTILFILVTLVAFVALAGMRNAGAESIHVCAWVEKPEPGQRCVTVNVLGYKGKLCK